MNFAEKVMFVRSELFLTQTQLAKELGVSQVTIARWETSKRKPQLVLESKFNKFCEKHGIIFDKE